MKIQSLSFATPVKNNYKNMNFGNRQRLTNLAGLKDVFEKMPPQAEEETAPVQAKKETTPIQTKEKRNPISPEPKIRYYYMGKDGNPHETTAPFVRKQAEYGERLYIMRSSNGKVKPRPFSGFSVEKDGEKEKFVIYESGYPELVQESIDGEDVKTTKYDTGKHKIRSVEKGIFTLEQDFTDDNITIRLRNRNEFANIYYVALSITNDSNNLSHTDITLYDGQQGLNPKTASISWNYLGEVPKKLEGLDKKTIKMFYDNLRNLAITIQSDEYGKDFGINGKFNHTLEELIYYIGKKIS